MEMQINFNRNFSKRRFGINETKGALKQKKKQQIFLRENEIITAQGD